MSTSRLLQNLGKFKDSQNKVIHLSSGALNNLTAPEAYLKLDEGHSSTSISTHDRYLQTKIEIAGTESMINKWLDEDIETTMDGIKID